MIDQWKIIISRLTAEHAGQPAKDGKYRVLSTMELLKPGEICSETYLVAGAFDSKEEATNYMDYLKTQFCSISYPTNCNDAAVKQSVIRICSLSGFYKKMDRQTTV